MYFSNGLIGFGSTLQQSATALTNYLKLKFNSSIIYIGDSVAGLAATNFALVSSPSAVISFAGVLAVNDYSLSAHNFLQTRVLISLLARIPMETITNR